MNPISLLYRRQFILGSRPILDFPGWKSIPFDTYHLTVHPDLKTTQAKGSNAEFLLLGFVLNHLRPEATNQELLDELAGTCNNFDEMLEYCRDLCGRYVILFDFSGKIGLLNDLIGSRSVYYCIRENELWCASQPSTLARLLGIEENYLPEVRTYIEKDMFASGEGCWIGDGTKYVGVKHLLSNHYLDFEEKKSFRYWPAYSPSILDVDYASNKSAAILENTMRAASNRFHLSLAVTSGWDSRCLLAATKKIQSEIFYYIQKYGDMTNNHSDIRIPRKLARKLGFTFHIIKCDDYQDKAFDDALEKNVFVLHNPAKKVLCRSFYQDFEGKVNASGNISDLCRTVYGIDPVNRPSDLLALVYLSDSEYAAASIKDWYLDAKERCDVLGYNLRDLFFWEQVLGNWGSMFAAELDIAIDEFYPFGTLRLVETILAVDEKLRPYNNSSVHRKMIELLWPELLSEPINPINWRMRTITLFNEKSKQILTRLGLLHFVKSLRFKIFGN